MKISRDRKARWLIPLLLFIGIIVDAALPAIFPGAFIGSSQIIISHLTLFYIVTFSFYLRDTHILFYAFWENGSSVTKSNRRRISGSLWNR